MYFLFRFSQPERLVQPESFGSFLNFLSAMETPSSAFLPSSWSAEILAGTLFNRDTEQVFFFALLTSYALFLPVAACWVSGAVYFEGWSKAQESRQGRRKHDWLDRLLNGLTRPFPAIIRALMVKDVKTFLRDTTQWSQIFLLVALIVVYLYNFKVLPLDRSPMPAGTIRTIASFANLSDMCSFTLALALNRWYFHHEGPSQFGGSDESIGYADATWEVGLPGPPTILRQPQSLTVLAGQPAQPSSSRAIRPSTSSWRWGSDSGRSIPISLTTTPLRFPRVLAARSV